MMKILIPVGGFFPAQNYGGPPVSIMNLCNLLAKESEFYVIACDHDLKNTRKLEGIEPGWNERYGINVIYLKDEQIDHTTFLDIVNEIKPDWVYLNSFFDARMVLPFLKIAKENDIRVLLAPRGQLNQGAFRKKYKKLPYIWYTKKYLRNVVFQSTCDEETDAICKWLCSDKNRINYLPNIPTIPSKKYLHGKEKGKLKIVFFSRICEKKNLCFALECLKSVLLGDIVFDVFGPLEDKAYWAKCQHIIDELPSNVTVNYKGIIKHEDIYPVISQYDLFFFPTFSENYGHVIAEALFAGLPILISDQTPWTDVNATMGGKAIPLADKLSFVEHLNRMLELDYEEYKVMSDAAYQYAYRKSNLDQLIRAYTRAFFDL